MARSTCGSSSTVSSAGRIVDCSCCMAPVPLPTDHTCVVGRASIRSCHRSDQGSDSPFGEVPQDIMPAPTRNAGQEPVAGIVETYLLNAGCGASVYGRCACPYAPWFGRPYQLLPF